MYPTKETLSAFIDGELDAKEHAQVAALVENDANLKAFVAEQEQLRIALHSAFANVIAAPIPERILATAANTPISFRLRLRQMFGVRPRARRDGAMARFVFPALTMALGLVVGVGVERSSLSTNDFSLSASTGKIVARAELARTLDQKLGSDEQSGATRIGVTFRDKAGTVCRSFEVSRNAATTDGFACHHDGDWQVGALITRPALATASTYALASASMPDAIRDAISDHIDGAPFDAVSERRARDRGWN